MTKNKVQDLLRNNGIWIIGCALYSIGVNSFSIPNSIAQSGITGLAVIVNHLTEFPVGTANLIMNIPLLILMWIFLGKKLVARTLWVTVILSTALDLTAFIPFTYTGNPLLAAIFCGVLQGTGLGLIMISGATSGGTDIVGRLVHKKWPHITVGTIVMIADAIVVTAGMLVFRSVESGLYAIVMIFVSTKVIDALLFGTGNGNMLMIVTDKADEVSQAIVRSSPRGVSVIPAKGAYTGTEKSVLLCVARKHEISGILKTVNSVDDKTFIIVSEANEILGKGFSHTI